MLHPQFPSLAIPVGVRTNSPQLMQPKHNPKTQGWLQLEKRSDVSGGEPGDFFMTCSIGSFVQCGVHLNILGTL
jgi:hypothetical protein